MAEIRGQEFQIANAQQNLASSEATLASARAELTQAQNNLSRTEASFNRSQQMHEEGLISREEYEQAQNSLKAARSSYEVSKSRLAQYETQVTVSKNNIEQMKRSYEASQNRLKSQLAQVTQATDNLRKTTITSPLSGVITQLNVEKGERAVPGVLNSPQATLMTIADLSVIQAELKVDETDIVSLALGNAAKIKVDALPVTIKAPSEKLRPGMSCTGDIITDTRTNILAIPIQALTIREVEVDKDGNYKEPDLNQVAKTDAVAQADSAKAKINKKELEGVFVITKDNRARFRPVKTGITGESEIEIKSNLQEGEVIVSGSFQTLRTLKDGALIKVDTTAKPETTKTQS
jgi:HlyD family secretion protein